MKLLCKSFYKKKNRLPGEENSRKSILLAIKLLSSDDLDGSALCGVYAPAGAAIRPVEGAVEKRVSSGCEAAGNVPSLSQPDIAGEVTGVISHTAVGVVWVPENVEVEAGAPEAAPLGVGTAAQIEDELGRSAAPDGLGVTALELSRGLGCGESRNVRAQQHHEDHCQSDKTLNLFHFIYSPFVCCDCIITQLQRERKITCYFRGHR